jgi:hypothetical protein
MSGVCRLNGIQRKHPDGVDGLELKVIVIKTSCITHN